MAEEFAGPTGWRAHTHAAIRVQIMYADFRADGQL